MPEFIMLTDIHHKPVAIRISNILCIKTDTYVDENNDDQPVTKLILSEGIVGVTQSVPEIVEILNHPNQA